MPKNRGNSWPTPQQQLLLQACLFSGAAAQEAWEKWTHCTSHFQDIDPASYKLLPLAACNPALAHIQDPIFKRSKEIYRQTKIVNRLHFEKALPLLTELQSKTGKLVLLKGIAMIVHYYCDFGARVIGDLDILISKSHLSTAIDTLHKSGWVSQLPQLDIQNAGQLSRWNAANFVHNSGMNVDLHWSFILESFPSLDTAVLQDSVAYPIQQGAFHLPTPTDLLLQTCIHGVKHCQVPLIRWVADAMTILNKAEQEIDWERLVHLAKTSYLGTPLSFALRYLIEAFQAPIPSTIFQELQAATPLEIREYRANEKGYKNIAAWHRFCLRSGHGTLSKQLLHLPYYLQYSALLKALWQVPFFAIYWICKRSLRYLFRKVRHVLE